MAVLEKLSKNIKNSDIRQLELKLDYQKQHVNLFEFILGKVKEISNLKVNIYAESNDIDSIITDTVTGMVLPYCFCCSTQCPK